MLILRESFRKARHTGNAPTDAETLSHFMRNYSKVLRRFNSSAFATQALNLATGKATWTERDEHIPDRNGSDIKARSYVPNDLPSDRATFGVIDIDGG